MPIETEPTPGGSGLKKRYGPLPLWGWGAVGVGAVALFLFMRKRSGAATGTQEQGIGFGTSTGGGGGGGGTGPTPPTPPANAPKPGSPNAPPTSPIAPAGQTTGDVPNTLAPAYVWNAATGRYDYHGYISDVTRSISSTVEFASQQVQKAGGGTAVAISTPFGQPEVVNQLNARGFTSAQWGGQIYAAKTSQDFFWGIPQDARANLARLLVGLKNAGRI